MSEISIHLFHFLSMFYFQEYHQNWTSAFKMSAHIFWQWADSPRFLWFTVTYPGGISKAVNFLTPRCSTAVCSHSKCFTPSHLPAQELFYYQPPAEVYIVFHMTDPSLQSMHDSTTEMLRLIELITLFMVDRMSKNTFYFLFCDDQKQSVGNETAVPFKTDVCQ